jgi:hypothetical protein
VIRAVIDTNGLLESIPNGSQGRWLYDAFMDRKFVWVFSNEILTEYAEMVGFYYSERTMELVTSILLAQIIPSGLILPTGSNWSKPMETITSLWIARPVPVWITS